MLSSLLRSTFVSLCLVSSLLSLQVLSASPAVVSRLPGYDEELLPFRLETGYVAVDEADDVQLFYYFVESEGDPSEDPLLVWLSGGPGCSVLNGVAIDIGPLNVVVEEYNGSVPRMTRNVYSWTKVSSIIFIDSPVGSGFSFSRSPEQYATGDVSSSKQVYEFLRKWLADHPQFLSNPFYVGGDSYAGKVVPIITQEIAKGNEDMQKPLINLKGYIVGNPITQDTDLMSRIPYSHGVGIISDELYLLAKTACEGDSYLHPKNADCAKALDIIEEFFSEISKKHILEPYCFDATDIIAPRRSLREEQKDNTLQLNTPPPPPLWCKAYCKYLLYQWANHDLVREALHTQKGTIGEWKRCNSDLQYERDVSSSVGYHMNLTRKGHYRALVYSGDHDLLVPHIGTRMWIDSLNSTINEKWHSWSIDGQVAGYTMAYSNNLTFATVKGGGHTVDCGVSTEGIIRYVP